MDLDLVARISNLSLYGYYDPSKDMVVAHFFNQSESKQNVIAFLNRDMSWDIREITSETCELTDAGETIHVEHNKICTQLKDSDFDKLVRTWLDSMGKKTYGDDANLEEKDKMFVILNHGYEKTN